MVPIFGHPSHIYCAISIPCEKLWSFSGVFRIAHFDVHSKIVLPKYFERSNTQSSGSWVTWHYARNILTCHAACNPSSQVLSVSQHLTIKSCSVMSGCSLTSILSKGVPVRIPFRRRILYSLASLHRYSI